MRRIFATAVAGVLGMLAIESATAGVRYIFETLTPGTDNGGGLVFLDGVIEFDRAFWALGQQFHHEVNNIDELVSPYFAANDLELVFFGAANGTTFDVLFGHNLTGSIVYGSQSDSVVMTGGPIWTVSEYFSDAAVECSPCDGLTGRWVLDLASVPEPGSLALLGLGLLSLGLTRRRAN